MQQVQQPIVVEELKENGQALTQEFRLRSQNGQESLIQLKMYGTFEDPLFRAGDVAQIFGVQNISQTLQNYNINEGIKGLCSAQSNQSQYFLTERGIYRYIYQSRSAIGEQFRQFVYELLYGLRTGKLQLIETENVQLKNAREQLQQQLLLTNQSFNEQIQQKDEEIEEKKEVIQQKDVQIQQKTEEIIQKDLDFDVLDGEYDILHESASQICQKERTKIPQNRAKHEFLMIIREEQIDGDIRYKAHCVQRYQRNTLLRKNYDDTLFNRWCVSAKQFWNSCNEIMTQNGHKTNGTCRFQLINDYTEDQLYEFLTDQLEILHQVPDQ